MRRLSKFFIGNIVYYNYVLNRHTEDNFEKCLATPFCATVLLSCCPRQMVLIQATVSWKWMRYFSKKKKHFCNFHAPKRKNIYLRIQRIFPSPDVIFKCMIWSWNPPFNFINGRESHKSRKVCQTPFHTAVEPPVWTTHLFCNWL